MPLVPATIQPTTNKNTESPDWRMLRLLWEQLARVINGQLSFGDGVNIDNVGGVWITVTTPVAVNTDFSINHTLGHPCVGYIVMSKSGACDVYTSPTVNGTPNTLIILRATGSAINLKLFLI